MPAKPALELTLTNAQKSLEPAWLWDTGRNRVVWANRAAIALFEGKSLFDVVDRLFDPLEPAVTTLQSLAAELKPGDNASASLAFPLQDTTLNVMATQHELADGRTGLLVVADAAKEPLAVADGIYKLAFSILSQPTAFMTRTGSIVQGNKAAIDLFGTSSPLDLVTLIDEKDRASRLLKQVQERSLVSTIEKLKCRVGLRDVRITLSRIEDEEFLAVAQFDDITDRRQLELQLAEQTLAQTPVPDLSRKEAFDKLAKKLKDTMQSQADLEKPKPVERPEPVVETQQKTKPPEVLIPETIRRAMERSGEAVVIARNGKIAFATTAAAKLFKLSVGENNQQVRMMLDSLADFRSPITTTEIIDAEGDFVSVDISVKTVPWQDGPAQQYIIRKANPDTPALQSSPEASADHEPPSLSRQLDVKELDTRPAPVAHRVTTSQIAMSRVAPNRDQSQHAAPDDELKAILDIASDGIITLDENGCILSFSAGAEAIFGHTTSDVVNLPMTDVLHEDSKRVWLDYVAALQGPGLASVFNDGREVVGLVKQGGTIPLFLALGHLQSTKSKARFCAVVRDITYFKRTEKELRDARDTAEEANRQKSVFLAHISHELRTPLNAIMGFSEVMQQEKFGSLPNEKYRSYADDIYASGQHLLSLIDDLLDLSRIEAGKLDLNFISVSLPEVTEHAVRMLQAEAAQRRVLLRMSFPPKLPAIVADLRSMRQIMMNLLSNAIKFTEPGGQVIMSAQNNDDGSVVWRVKDSGIGMNDEQIQTALEPFKRIATQGRETEGTGLGLPLAKALVLANRATMEVTSKPGKGTLVEIAFPTNRVLAD